MEGIEPFDLVVFLALFAMFIVGYAQGLMRRLFGTAAILFSIGIAAQLRTPFGSYLAREWTAIAPEYSYMVAFGAVFLAAAITLSVGIQLSYRPAPLLTRYPVLDEILGGVVGVIEGVVILMAVLLILDPYFTGVGLGHVPGTGEFGVLRSLDDLIDNAASAQILREHVIPGVLSIFGFLFPKDVLDAFTAAMVTRT